MTSTPSRSKGKSRVPTDWQLRAIADIPSITQLSALELPMEVIPEQKDTVPAANAVNTQFLISRTAEGPPWTGYYATFRGAQLAISNIYGIWCKIRHRGTGFEAHCLARAELSLLDAPLQGIDYSHL